MGKDLVVTGLMVEGDPERGRDGRWLFHHTLLHFPFFSLRWNFRRRLVQTSLHWITRLFLSAIRPTLSAPELGAPGLGTDPGPTAVPLSLPPINKNRLLIWILGHLQARSFMWTQRTLSPRFKGSPRLLYTETTFTENLAQSPMVSISRTFTWTAMDTFKNYAQVILCRPPTSTVQSGFLTIILLAVFLHVYLQISFDWFTVGVTVCRDR